ncbi:PD-(D/E)XK nuclease family protein [Natronoarchaeum rubrum]|uniref:PD-(D/E)XK nuclease family protein n=1 Tax=Natronoarchaeum rubrum TaxID=755311 RepID=UPI0021110819|nr:PD-(D/E)XK nuclease family protein [Natronoarchaeum rubrum]
MSSSSEVDDRFLKLINEANQSSPSTFDLLAVGDDERSHTRILAWLLNPDNSHGLDLKFIRRFLERANVNDLNGLSGANVRTFSQEPDRTELDILIQTESVIICVEIKTTHQLTEDQYDRQIEYLKNQITDTSERVESYEYLYLSPDESHDLEFANQITWREVVDELKMLLPEFERDCDVIRTREWIQCLEDQVINSFSFTPDTELQLRYNDLVEHFDITIDEATVYRDRKRLFKKYWQWVEEQFEDVTSGKDGWDEKLMPSMIREDTPRVKFSKTQWDDNGIRFEVHGTKMRLYRAESHANDWDKYRTLDPHIEMTMTYQGANPEERDAFLSHLSTDYDRILQNAGFVEIREQLPADADVDINKYHIYSKQVPLSFENETEVLEELKEGTRALLQLEESLDNYLP